MVTTLLKKKYYLIKMVSIYFDSDDDRFVINTIAYRDLDRG